MQSLPRYKLAALHWSIIDRQMRAVEGDEWAQDCSPEFMVAADGGASSHGYWRVGGRCLSVEDGHVVETTIVHGDQVLRSANGAGGSGGDASPPSG